MPTHKEKKFDQSNSKKPSFTTCKLISVLELFIIKMIIIIYLEGNKPPAHVPAVVSTWNSSPEICFDGLSLDGDDGGGSADDEDNLAYAKIVVCAL